MNKWDRYFMKVAEDTAELSKDPVTKVGAVIVQDKRIKSAGYNGAPANFPDDKIPVDNDGPSLIDKKNTFMCHAELNAILNYDGKVSSLKDAIMYTTISPCSRCACMIAQLGIKKVIYKEKYHRTEETDATDYIFKECGVSCIDYNDLN